MPAVVRVALDVPLRRTFDYLVPEGAMPAPGVRVAVPFGRRMMTGMVVESGVRSALGRTELRPVARVLDAGPLLPGTLFELLRWAAGYYHHPLGEVLFAALPAALRRGRAAAPRRTRRYRLAAAEGGAHVGTRAVCQQRILACLAEAGAGGMEERAIRARVPRSATALRRLEALGLIVGDDCPPAPSAATVDGPPLADAQALALASIREAFGHFRALVIHGVTGSGKTEVYMAAARECLAAGRQVLLLVPEIALTPQLVERVRERVSARVAVFHSSLAAGERHDAWWRARAGEADIVLGTRSAVFVPLARPGLIVVDEEHDGSYKQQEGFRYHARDLAVSRARLEGVPVVLGSATPSLETELNCRRGRYRRLTLPDRAGGARLPSVAVVDLGSAPRRHGLTPQALSAIGERLARGEQSLVFINRRGFAPLVMCRQCGWRAQCRRCDARMVLHRRSGRLRCHHCGAAEPAPAACPECGGTDLSFVGEGSQRLEEVLEKTFANAGIVRIDRDTVANGTALENLFERIRSGAAQILVGTQMLSKGHDFPGVTLVCIVNADQGLYSLDFRASERLYQQVVQVAGRAGRAERPGTVLIQTFHPREERLALIAAGRIDEFLDRLLAERSKSSYPPFARLALVRAEAATADRALAFLRRARTAGLPLLGGDGHGGVALMDAVPSPMERRAGRYRAQLLVRARARGPLHGFLERWLPAVESLPDARRVRWSVDVDPLDLF